MVNPRYQHPADLIAHVQRSHGTPVGPPPDQYAEPAPTADEPWHGRPRPPQIEQQVSPETLRSDVEDLKRIEARIAAESAKPELPPESEANDYVLLDAPETARFMGYTVELSQGEVADLKQVLAGAVVRVLEEQKAKVRDAIPSKKRRG